MKKYLKPAYELEPQLEAMTGNLHYGVITNDKSYETDYRIIGENNLHGIRVADAITGEKFINSGLDKETSSYYTYRLYRSFDCVINQAIRDLATYIGPYWVNYNTVDYWCDLLVELGIQEKYLAYVNTLSGSNPYTLNPDDIEAMELLRPKLVCLLDDTQPITSTDGDLYTALKMWNSIYIEIIHKEEFEDNVTGPTPGNVLRLCSSCSKFYEVRSEISTRDIITKCPDC